MKNPYVNLAVQTLVGGVIMYFVMFVMIDRLSSFFNNLNMLYMALMMVTPMVVLMIAAMPHMFPSKRANAALLIGSAAVFVASFALIRTQTTIGDTAFLRSMIPHHSGAIRRRAVRYRRNCCPPCLKPSAGKRPWRKFAAVLRWRR